jgi:hypothetical protein
MFRFTTLKHTHVKKIVWTGSLAQVVEQVKDPETQVQKGSHFMWPESERQNEK